MSYKCNNPHYDEYKSTYDFYACIISHEFEEAINYLDIAYGEKEVSPELKFILYLLHLIIELPDNYKKMADDFTLEEMMKE
ncbi:MAG TPA: hypothetical protein DCY94_05165, partial [Firmicutes bacterium]|nr:hypothetical protein [Bacillota bacterium]